MSDQMKRKVFEEALKRKRSVVLKIEIEPESDDMDDDTTDGADESSEKPKGFGNGIPKHK